MSDKNILCNGYWYPFAWTRYHRKADLVKSFRSPRVRRFGCDFRNWHILADFYLSVWKRCKSTSLVCSDVVFFIKSLQLVEPSSKESLNVSKDASFHNLILKWKELEGLIRKSWSKSGGQEGTAFPPDRHTRQTPTQSDIYQMMYWYNSILLMMSIGLLETCREEK